MLLEEDIPAEDKPELKIYYEQIAKAFNKSLESIGESKQPPFLFRA